MCSAIQRKLRRLVQVQRPPYDSKILIIRFHNVELKRLNFKKQILRKDQS